MAAKIKNSGPKLLTRIQNIKWLTQSGRIIIIMERLKSKKRWQTSYRTDLSRVSHGF
jgi:hypothetical protein